MGQYSEMIGSFIRTGTYSLEADYIFANVTELKDFYSQPENSAIMHKGWLKIVEDDGTGAQAIYWVTKKQTNEELEFTKLISSTDGGDIQELIEKLDQEIQDRIDGDDAIWGTRNHALVPDDLNSLLDISTAITDLRTRVAALELSQDQYADKLRRIIGTTEEDYMAYLETLDYSSLTELSDAIIMVLDKIQEEFDKIYGTPIPSPEFRTLRGIEDYVRLLGQTLENEDANLHGEIDQTQIGVGLDSDGKYSADQETNYLKTATSVMNALKILDGLTKQALDRIITLTPINTDVVPLDIVKNGDVTTIAAKLLISGENNNGILKKSDGIYMKVSQEYSSSTGTLTLNVNDSPVSTIPLGLNFVGIEDAYYDTTTEDLVINFQLTDGSIQVIRVSVSNLIRAWAVDNSNPSKVVELTREEVYGEDPDKLSADVRLFVDKYNILVKQGNTLYVKGTSDNIVHNDVKLSIVLDNITNSISEAGSDIDILDSALVAEVNRAKAAEALIANNLVVETTRATAEEQRIETKFETRTDSLDARVTSNTNAIDVLDTRITDEAQRSIYVETNLSNNLALETARAEAEEARIETKFDGITNGLKDDVDALDNKIDSNLVEINTLKTRLNDEITRATDKETQISNSVNTETTRAQGVEQNLSDRITNNTTAISGEISRSTAKDESLDLKITNETTRATTKEDLLNTAITAEITRATSEEARLETEISTNTTDIESNTNLINDLRDDLNIEITRASTKEDQLSDRITNETTRAISEENRIELRIVSEVNQLDIKINDVETELSEHALATNNPHEVTKTQVGLSNVDNTSDMAKPISTAQQAKFSDLENTMVTTFSELETDISTKTNNSDFTSHITNNTNPHNVTKAQVGLGNVDNTSDINKPVSTLTQSALDLKAPINNPVFTGIPQVLTNPDSGDISNRIASTYFVNKEIGRLIWGDYD